MLSVNTDNFYLFLFDKSGKEMKAVTDFIFLDSEITEDGDCNHEIKRCFLLRKKVVMNLDSISKSRDIIFQQMSIQLELCFFQ